MLGLKRHTVKLVPHQAFWEQAFNDTKKELEDLIGDHYLDIQHIGSTSIGGIMAKPILDVAILIASLNDLERIRPILEHNNFAFRGDAGKDGGLLFVRDSKPEFRTHHIHLIEKDDPQWTNYLFFRDELNRNTLLAQAYTEVKKELALKYSYDRRSYTTGKNQFIKRVLSKNTE